MQTIAWRAATVAALILLSTAHGPAFGADDGFLFDLGVGRAEQGVGLRPSVGVGYGFDSGWAVQAFSQRLQQSRARVIFVGIGQGVPNTFTTVEEKSPEVRSEAIAVSFGWRIGKQSPWRSRVAVGAHSWRWDAHFGRFPLSSHMSASGVDPYVRFEASRALSRRTSIGVAAERFWLDLGDTTRASVFFRVRIGGSD